MPASRLHLPSVAANGRFVSAQTPALEGQIFGTLFSFLAKAT